MASEEEPSEINSLFDRLVRDRDLSVFMLLMLTNPRTEPEQGAEAERGAERIILINLIGQSMTVMEGTSTSSLEDLIQDMAGEEGQPPASKAAIKAMPSVEIGGDGGAECAICLEEWKVGGLAKEMPCKHRFHGGCIDKWLGIHGSCPVCRYTMPVDQSENKKRLRNSDDDGDEQGRFTRIGFSFNGARTTGPTTDSTDSSSSQ